MGNRSGIAEKDGPGYELEEKSRLLEAHQTAQGCHSRDAARPKRINSQFDRTSHADGSDDIEDHSSHYARLTTGNTIPKVRKCNYMEFMNRFKEEDGRYAVDVLISGPDFEQEVQEEQRLRERLLGDTGISSRPKKGKARGFKTTAHGGLPNSLSKDSWIHRIRLQSPTLLKIMSRVQKEPFSPRPRTFCRPFDSLIFFQHRMKEELQNLEDSWGTSLLGIDGTWTNEAMNTPGGPEHEDEDSVDNSPAALAIMRCYVKFIEEEVVGLYGQFSRLDAYSPLTEAKVRFSDLWFLFRTGEFVYRPSGKDLSAFRESSMGMKLWRTHCIRQGDAQYRMLPSDHSKYDSEEKGREDASFKVRCHYIDYTGDEFCVVTKAFSIPPYSGFKPITSLPVFPVRFLAEYQDFMKEKIEMGERVLRFIGEKHGSYNAWTVIRTPEGDPVVGADGVILKHPEHIHSEVMIDFGEAFQACPTWKPKRTVLRKKPLESSSVSNETPILWWSDSSRSRRLGETSEIISIRSSVSVLERNRYISEDALHFGVLDNVSKGQFTTQQLLRDEDKAILVFRVFAYVFQERKWAQLDIRAVTPVTMSRDALDSLRIPQKNKDLIQDSVRGHLIQRAAERAVDTKMTLDFIRGKGEGLFILLHGVPGVGKTATAETIAQTNGKPLFKITCGDLGLSPEQVESSLRDIFRLASSWDCILLLDEVDTFFSQRSKGDAAMTKNALVSVFLRVLDYYNGILFMTTNRSGALDEAFKSRIHCKIYYPPLTKEQTLDIWQINVQRLRQMEEEQRQRYMRISMDIPEDEILHFASKHFDSNGQGGGRWNGRQIRNAFQVAKSLAYAEAERASGTCRGGKAAAPRLDIKHFETVHDITAEFNIYMKSVYAGHTDGDLARDMEVRDDNWPGRWPRRPQEWSEGPVLEGSAVGGPMDTGLQRHGFSGFGRPARRNSQIWSSGANIGVPGPQPRQQGWGPSQLAGGTDGLNVNGPMPKGIRPRSPGVGVDHPAQNQAASAGGFRGMSLGEDYETEMGPSGASRLSPTFAAAVMGRDITEYPHRREPLRKSDSEADHGYEETKNEFGKRERLVDAARGTFRVS